MATGSPNETPWPQVLWLGPARDPSGHADELRGFLRAQERAGHEPALIDLPWTQIKTELSRSDDDMLRMQHSRGPRRKPDVAVHTYLPHAGNPIIEGAVNVQRAMFETDRLPQKWLPVLLERDEVWVPCRQNYEAFADSGIPARKMRIVGGTLDFELFSPGVEPYPLDVDPDRRVFLTNFDFSARKGWETLLRSWGQAFDAEDPVCLVLKTGSFYANTNEVEERITAFLRREFTRRQSRLAPIQLMTDLLSAVDMPRLYAAADAYVLASRGEGWGRPYMEAQAMGLPTIASHYGGQLQFMDEDTSWLVGGRLVEVPEDADLFNDLYRGHRWFEPDADDLADKLRDIAGDWDEARRRGAPARQRLIDRFGYEATARTIREGACSVMERFGDPSRPSCFIRGLFGSTASLATVNEGLANELEEFGSAVHHRPPGCPPVADPGVGITHSWPPDFRPVTEGPTVVILPWEYGSPPRGWIEKARTQADRIWVPSEYVRRGFVRGGMPPGIVEVIPNGFEPARFSPDGPALSLPIEAACTFLFVGGTIWRKGVDLLIAAWSQAFRPYDDVALVIKDFGSNTWYRGQTAGDSIREFAARGESAPIIYFDEDLPARDIAPLYRAADVLVVPYRGEGFCLPALEAMACGLPVIHTGTGPTGEFVPDDAGWPVAAREVEVPPHFDIDNLAGPATVQEVDIASLAAALREAASDPEQRAARGRCGLAASSQYTWAAVAARAEKSLAILRDEALPPARFARPDAVETPTGNTLVLYAPDWRDTPTWAATLDRWAQVFADSDPITFALPCGDQDPEALTGRIVEVLQARGHDPAAVPDLMLCAPDISLADLVAAADVVVVDDSDRDRPALVRRARHVARCDEAALRQLRATLTPPRPLRSDLRQEDADERRSVA